MNLKIFLKSVVVSVGFALVVSGIFGNELMFFVKSVAIAIGISLLFSIIYPHIRGVKKGDRITVVSGNLPMFLGIGRMGTALTDGLLHQEIRVKMDDGREAVGIVESYEQMFSPAKIRLIYEEKLVE